MTPTKFSQICAESDPKVTVLLTAPLSLNSSCSLINVRLYYIYIYIYIYIVINNNDVECNRDELRLGHGRQRYFSSYEKILMGDRVDNIRARLPATSLTADQQVACLIDLATDPNVLGRAWAGWGPWM